MRALGPSARQPARIGPRPSRRFTTPPLPPLPLPRLPLLLPHHSAAAMAVAVARPPVPGPGPRASGAASGLQSTAVPWGWVELGGGCMASKTAVRWVAEGVGWGELAQIEPKTAAGKGKGTKVHWLHESSRGRGVSMLRTERGQRQQPRGSRRP